MNIYKTAIMLLFLCFLSTSGHAHNLQLAKKNKESRRSSNFEVDHRETKRENTARRIKTEQDTVMKEIKKERSVMEKTRGDRRAKALKAQRAAHKKRWKEARDQKNAQWKAARAAGEENWKEIRKQKKAEWKAIRDEYKDNN